MLTLEEFGIQSQLRCLPDCPQEDFPHKTAGTNPCYALKKFFNYGMTSIKIKISEKWKTLMESVNSKLHANVTYKAHACTVW